MNYLHGQLNTPLSKANYGGKDTSSLKMIVDNDKMTISGEVIWDDMLGETVHKAYPGNLGTRNYNKIIELAQALQQEIARSTALDTGLSTDLTKGLNQIRATSETLNKRMDDEAEKINTLSNELTATVYSEINRAIQAEAELLKQINAETDIRDAADQKFKDQLDTILSNITSGTDGINLLLQAEADRAIAAEKKLEGQIDEEIRRALFAEKDLNEKLTSSVLSMEAVTTNLQSQLISEISNREAEIKVLKDLLDLEVERSQNKDLDHDTLLEAHSKSIEERVREIAGLTGITSAHDEAINQTIQSIDTLEKDIDGLVNEHSNMNALIGENKNLLDNEITRAKDAENLLHSQILDHTSAIETINPIIYKNKGDVQSLIQNVERIDTSLRDISLELDRDVNLRDSQYTELSSNLSKEIERATSFDGEIQTKVDDGFKAINDSIEDLKVDVYFGIDEFRNADAEIQSQINLETNIRNEKDIELKELIEGENRRAEKAEEGLQEQLDGIEDKLSDSFVKSVNIDGGVTKVYAVTGQYDIQIEATDQAVPYSIVTHNENGNITLPQVVDEDDFDKFQDNEAIPKAYVNLINDSIQSRIDDEIAKIYRIDFIDGGNAPID